MLRCLLQWQTTWLCLPRSHKPQYGGGPSSSVNCFLKRLTFSERLVHHQLFQTGDPNITLKISLFLNRLLSIPYFVADFVNGFTADSNISFWLQRPNPHHQTLYRRSVRRWSKCNSTSEIDIDTIVVIASIGLVAFSTQILMCCAQLIGVVRYCALGSGGVVDFGGHFGLFFADFDVICVSWNWYQQMRVER